MNVHRVVKKACIFTLSIVLLACVSIGGTRLLIQSKLNASGDSTKKEIVNTVMNEMIKHPVETKKMLDSIHVAEEEKGMPTPPYRESTNPLEQHAKTNKMPVGVDGAEKNELGSNKAVFSIKYMRSHLSEYALLKSGAKNLGGNTYRLTATVRHRPTGKIGMVSVTTHLSESMKEMLRKYR